MTLSPKALGPSPSLTSGFKPLRCPMVRFRMRANSDGQGTQSSGVSSSIMVSKNSSSMGSGVRVAEVGVVNCWSKFCSWVWGVLTGGAGTAPGLCVVMASARALAAVAAALVRSTSVGFAVAALAAAAVAAARAAMSGGGAIGVMGGGGGAAAAVTDSTALVARMDCSRLDSLSFACL